ncbi:MAG: hypothetical protein BGO74_16350 [Burkholderiales bacterium 68-12]|uniref:hypothetical protein n=1 Tax=Comamonas granuli TaxID=290309 RepID=UPI0005A70E1C|nr:hypothetical protein [Comamonas granuli]OJX33259.1 MAG: hypothetical protein BGO74_16350 [Burkholderiales bacterium 68-12]
MHSVVTVCLDKDQEFRFELDGVEPMAHEQARLWLDGEFTRMECEPLRASGKVLLADKVLVVARAAGASLLGDRAWLGQFARAASAALSRPVVRIDLAGMTINY